MGAISPCLVGEYSPILASMEKLISDIEVYCARSGITPQRLLKLAIGANHGQWQDWKDGKSSPRFGTGDRIRAYMQANPPLSAAP